MQPELPNNDAPAAGKADDGSVVVRLVTSDGEADITVPPRERWRSTARSALNRDDDLTWAVLTLSDEDGQKWLDMDPTAAEARVFFEELSKKMGLNNRADRRRLRSVG